MNEWMWIWLAITVVALVVEFVTFELVSAWFVPSGIIAFVLACFNVNPYVQVAVFVVLSLALLFAFRKMFMRMLKKDNGKTNNDLIIGKQYRLLTAIGFNEPGSIKINGVVWSACLLDETLCLPEGTLVEVVEIKGNKLIVKEI